MEIQKKRAYIHHHHHHQDKQLSKINLKQYYIGKGEITLGKQLRKINLEQDYIDKGEITQDKLDAYGPVDKNRNSVLNGYYNNGGDDYGENRHTAGEYDDFKTRTKAVVNKGYDDDDDYPY